MGLGQGRVKHGATDPGRSKPLRVWHGIQVNQGPKQPRIAPLPPDSDPPTLSIFRTLARSAPLYKTFLEPRRSSLDGGVLPARVREIVILRISRATLRGGRRRTAWPDPPSRQDTFRHTGLACRADRRFCPRYRSARDVRCSQASSPPLGPPDIGITNIRTSVNPEDPTRVAVLMDVADMDVLNAAMQDKPVADAMAYDGVLPETVVVLVEA